MIGCAHNDTVQVIQLQELQERIQDSSDLANIILCAALTTERIELVEEIDSSGTASRLPGAPMRSSFRMGREPVRSDAIPLTLFQHDAVNAHSERIVQGHVGDTGLGVTNR